MIFLRVVRFPASSKIPSFTRLWNLTPSTPLRAGSNVEKRDVRMGHPVFSSLKILGKILYSYLRHAPYLKHADLELRFRDHVSTF